MNITIDNHPRELQELAETEQYTQSMATIRRYLGFLGVNVDSIDPADRTTILTSLIPYVLNSTLQNSSNISNSKLSVERMLGGSAWSEDKDVSAIFTALSENPSKWSCYLSGSACLDLYRTGQVRAVCGGDVGGMWNLNQCGLQMGDEALRRCAYVFAITVREYAAAKGYAGEITFGTPAGDELIAMVPDACDLCFSPDEVLQISGTVAERLQEEPQHLYLIGDLFSMPGEKAASHSSGLVLHASSPGCSVDGGEDALSLLHVDEHQRNPSTTLQERITLLRQNARHSDLLKVLDYYSNVLTSHESLSEKDIDVLLRQYEYDLLDPQLRDKIAETEAAGTFDSFCMCSNLHTFLENVEVLGQGEGVYLVLITAPGLLKIVNTLWGKIIGQQVVEHIFDKIVGSAQKTGVKKFDGIRYGGSYMVAFGPSEADLSELFRQEVERSLGTSIRLRVEGKTVRKSFLPVASSTKMAIPPGSNIETTYDATKQQLEGQESGAFIEKVKRIIKRGNGIEVDMLRYLIEYFSPEKTKRSSVRVTNLSNMAVYHPEQRLLVFRHLLELYRDAMSGDSLDIQAARQVSDMLCAMLDVPETGVVPGTQD